MLGPTWGYKQCDKLVTLQWSGLWDVIYLQTLCWEIGDKSRWWNKTISHSEAVIINRLHLGHSLLTHFGIVQISTEWRVALNVPLCIFRLTSIFVCPKIALDRLRVQQNVFLVYEKFIWNCRWPEHYFYSFLQLIVVFIISILL